MRNLLLAATAVIALTAAAQADQRFEAAKAGDGVAKPRFDAAHRLSVILNMVQMLVVAAVLARFATA